MSDFDEESRRRPIQQFLEQFRDLDLQNVERWSKSVKVIVCALLFILTMAVGYMVLLNPLQDDITQQQQHQQTLLQQYQEQYHQLQNGQYLQQQVQELREYLSLEQVFPTAEQLPNIVEQINVVAKQSGLFIVNLRLESENRLDELIEQPILLEAEGDYHQFGRFVSLLAGLKSVVAVENFSIVASSSSMEDIPIVQYKVKLKVYLDVNDDIKQPIAERNKEPTTSGVSHK